MIRRPPRSTPTTSSAASDVYKRQIYSNIMMPSNEVTTFDESKLPKLYNSSMDAITKGTRDGLEIALSVGAILIVFITLVA